MSVFSWFFQSKPKPVSVVSEPINLEKLDDYIKNKTAVAGINYDSISKDLSPLDIAKTVLAEELAGYIRGEVNRAKTQNRAPDFERILYTAYRLNKDLENGTLEGEGYSPDISRSDFMRRPSYNDYGEKKSQFRKYFERNYFNKMQDIPTGEEIPKKLSTGSLLGTFGKSSTLHTILYDLYKQCTQKQFTHKVNTGIHK